VQIYDAFSAQALAITYDALGRPSELNDTVNPPRSLNYFGAELVEEMVGGVVDRQYTNHPMLGRIATTTSGGMFWHLYDARQNLIATLDSAGLPRELIRYDGFGFPTINTIGPPSGIEPMFGGMRQLDIPGTPPPAPVSNWPCGPYLGMYRLYDASNGVWMSQDSLGYIDGPNRNDYVGFNLGTPSTSEKEIDFSFPIQQLRNIINAAADVLKGAVPSHPTITKSITADKHIVYSGTLLSGFGSTSLTPEGLHLLSLSEGTGPTTAAGYLAYNDPSASQSATIARGHLIHVGPLLSKESGEWMTYAERRLYSIT
jgi:hypothetical protein